MGDLIEQLRKRILTLNEQGIMPDLVRELEGSILKIEQLQADLEAIMQQRDSYRHQSTALNLLNEQLEDRCAELGRELEWMQTKYNTEMRIRQAYQSGSEEVARKAFVDGADWQMNEQAYNEGVIVYAAEQYIEREYGIKEQQ